MPSNGDTRFVKLIVNSLGDPVLRFLFRTTYGANPFPTILRREIFFFDRKGALPRVAASRVVPKLFQHQEQEDPH